VLVPAAAWKEFRGARAVTIALDGALYRLPFEALTVGPASDRAAARAWIDEGPAIRYAGSATSMLGVVQRRARAAGDSARATTACLSVSDPDFARGAAAATRWEALPGTTRESASIVAAFAPESVRVLSGAAATEAAVRATLAGERYLHFATHGYVGARGHDVLAGLALTAPPLARAGETPGGSVTGGPATDPGDDGLLQAFEILDLPITARLVVLSACETQRGTRVEGEGVFALSRAFLAAGAERVIATLWSVNDASTATLIGDCFRSIAAARRRGGAVAYAEALRDAKRALRRDPRFADPFYWAPFTLTGAP
jgi:CHAT domain-containing protein